MFIVRFRNPFKNKIIAEIKICLNIQCNLYSTYFAIIKNFCLICKYLNLTSKVFQHFITGNVLYCYEEKKSRNSKCLPRSVLLISLHVHPTRWYQMLFNNCSIDVIANTLTCISITYCSLLKHTICFSLNCCAKFPKHIQVSWYWMKSRYIKRDILVNALLLQLRLKFN